jgi:hypothetical protein
MTCVMTTKDGPGANTAASSNATKGVTRPAGSGTK